IDNIDFAAATYSWGHMYDTAQQTSHATLRMLFQFTLPISLDSITGDESASQLSLLSEESLFTDNLCWKTLHIQISLMRKMYTQRLSRKYMQVVTLSDQML